jgi:hypothetical protein
LIIPFLNYKSVRYECHYYLHNFVYNSNTSSKLALHLALTPNDRSLNWILSDRIHRFQVQNLLIKKTLVRAHKNKRWEYRVEIEAEITGEIVPEHKQITSWKQTDKQQSASGNDGACEEGNVGKKCC